MAGLTKVSSLLKKLNYIVTIEKLDGGCVVSYPDCHLLADKHLFILENDGFILSTNAHSTYYNIEPYAIRLSIMLHVIMNCLNRNYCPNYIQYYDGNKRVKSIEDIIQIECDGEAELQLADICLEFVGMGIDTLPQHQRAKKNKVLVGFKQLIHLLEKT